MAPKRTVVVYAEPTLMRRRRELRRREGALFTFEATVFDHETDTFAIEAGIQQYIREEGGAALDDVIRREDGRLYAVIEPATPEESPAHLCVDIQYEPNITVWDAENEDG